MNKIELRKCGNSDLQLAVLGMGCWAFGGGNYWGEQNQNDVNDIVHAAVDYGINYFDTAEAYNDGRSESSLGQALKDLPRDKVVIGTKISPSNTEPLVLREHLEASLKRLETDYIDLYMVHWPITPHSIAHFTEKKICPDVREAFSALQNLRKEGKIRYIGVSNFAVSKMEEIKKFLPDICANELPYSLLTRAIEFHTIPFLKKNKIGIIGYMTLLQGLLADIYPSLDDVPVMQRRTRHFNSKKNKECRHGEAGAEEETTEALSAIREVMKKIGMNMPELAINWAVSNPAVSTALVGARSVQELKNNIKAVLNPRLDRQIMAELNNGTDKLLLKLGAGFDFYENSENDRTR
ncbi:MAG: hypothetical protein A2096_16755 [Spirochaetes bacterium GWF1_41_5]|nr:MAG: hypothetical protein A2096_16755 [Spirochaetes bacterium GWF1_41_5]HBE03819.1 hypothetical protein [Spirochaetia bacterium]